MTYKLICPWCDTYTSAVFRAYEDGRPCPRCEKPLHDSDGRTARSYYAQLSDEERHPPLPS
jgi:transcription initiation factor IIE alpha subunit